MAAESIEIIDFLEFARQRWKAAALICGFAVATALALSLLLPKKYTATASMIIEPPAASDPRISTAVSPVYLESLKTYEQFASSDSLFARACEKFHLLSGPNAPAIESFKRRVLRVNKPKDTKILQIAVTLGDPRQAQRLVQFLAEETANLNRSIDRASESEILEQARDRAARAALELTQAQSALASAGAGQESLLEAQLIPLAKLEADVRGQLVEVSGLIAEYEARESALSSLAVSAAELPALRQELAAARAKAASLRASHESITRELTAKSAALAQARARRGTAEARVRTAQTAYDAAAKRVMEVEGFVGARAEQLRIIDPGIVPQRPSFPNLPLNCAAALLLGVVISAAYTAMRFGLERQRVRFARASFRVARGGGN
jgi:capsular polysaccharide biosynthesis protein